MDAAIAWRRNIYADGMYAVAAGMLLIRRKCHIRDAIMLQLPLKKVANFQGTAGHLCNSEANSTVDGMQPSLCD